MNDVASLLCLVIQIYTLVLFARLLLSWFPIPADGALASVNRGLWAATEPVLAPIRAVVRPVQVGAMAIDLSPLLLLVALFLLSSLACR